MTSAAWSATVSSAEEKEEELNWRWEYVPRRADLIPKAGRAVFRRIGPGATKWRTRIIGERERFTGMPIPKGKVDAEFRIESELNQN